MTTNLNDQIASIFSGGHKNVFLFDSAPDKKRRNAIRSFASQMGSGETILVQYDDTVWGSAKEGYILTNRALYAKNFGEGAETPIALTDVTDVTYRENLLANVIQVHGRHASLKIELHIVEDDEAFFRATRETVALLAPQMAAARNPVMVAQTVPQRVSTHCPGCGAVGMGAFCEYCGAAIIAAPAPVAPVGMQAQTATIVNGQVVQAASDGQLSEQLNQLFGNLGNMPNQ